MDTALPAIPAKRYFTIGEVSDLCGVKAYVLRYWEQEFTQLRPMKRRGNRRYYQHHEVLLIRRIRELLYEEGFTISGARNRLAESMSTRRATGAQSGGTSGAPGEAGALPEPVTALPEEASQPVPSSAASRAAVQPLPATLAAPVAAAGAQSLSGDTVEELMRELKAIRRLLED